MAPGLGGFFRGLFGGGPAAPEASAPAGEYGGFTIQPAPQAPGRPVDHRCSNHQDHRRHAQQYRLIRVDLFATRDDAAAASIAKAKRTIDEQCDGLFGSSRLRLNPRRPQVRSPISTNGAQNTG